MKSRLAEERGQALILIAFAMVGLVAIVGLAIDGGAKFSDRRHAQNAADTAALAAALAKVDALIMGVSDNSPTTNSPTTCPPPSGILKSPVCEALLLAGLDRADSNGYGNNLTTNTVEIYSPPISGYYMDDEDYVQVIITSTINTTFSRVIGRNQTTNIVQAVALAEPGGKLAEGAMIISYDPDPSCNEGEGIGGGSVVVSGDATLKLTGGGIFLNAGGDCGYKAPNCPTIEMIDGGAISSVSTVDNIFQKCTAAPEYLKQEPLDIPDDVDIPKPPKECGDLATAYNDPPGSNTWHITPGYYSDFPQSNINGDIVGNKKDIVMDPGIYCVGKDIKWSGNTFTSLDGSSGITLYLKSGVDFSLSINSPIILYASHSGSDLDGYLVVQQGTHTDIHNCTINGGTYLDLEGLIFTPYCNITINGGGEETAEINAQVIGWDIKIDGNNIINFNYDPSKVIKIKRKVGLMK